MSISINGAALAGPGHNNPPKTPFELSSEEIEALFEEATAWCDGSGVNNAAEEHNVDALLDMLRDAKKRADASRAAEKKPHDDAAKAVQAIWLPIISKADLAADACKKALAPYRKRIADEKAAAAERRRIEAEAKRREAEEAFRASKVDNLAEREKAEALLTEAKKAEKVADKAEKTATTNTGLRRSYVPKMTNPREAITHYWATRRDDVAAYLLTLAKSDVAAGQNKIPGFEIEEIRSVV